MLELDGLLTTAMADVVPTHNVDSVWEDTGYTGLGATVAIIDTGIDGAHAGLDDMDDDNATDDPKVIAFYDPVNTPNLRNGTEVFPYDDQVMVHIVLASRQARAPPITSTSGGFSSGARLVGVKVLDAGGSELLLVMAGMEWTVEKRHVFNIRSASMSLGGPGVIEWTSSEEDSVNRMANRMMEENVALFIAAGNSLSQLQIGTSLVQQRTPSPGLWTRTLASPSTARRDQPRKAGSLPNIASSGPDVMALDFNTGTAATGRNRGPPWPPGAAGVGALIRKRIRELTAFEMRNMMQETATYRQCHYMGVNGATRRGSLPRIDRTTSTVTATSGRIYPCSPLETEYDSMANISSTSIRRPD